MYLKNEQPRPKTRRFYHGWVIALCCTLITIINGGIFFSFSVFFKPVTLDFGWSRGEFAGSYTAMLIAYAPGALIAGRLADRHGPRVILVLAGLLIGLGFMGCSQATNLTVMTLSYAVIGFGLGATLALPTATIQRWFVKRRGSMLGMVVAGTGIGGLFFPPLANYLITLYGWQSAYMVIGIIDGAVIATSALFLISEPKTYRPGLPSNTQPGLAHGSKPQDSTLLHLTSKQVFKLGAFWGIAAIFILVNTPDFFIKSQLVPYIIDQGVSANTGAQSLGLIAGAMVFGRITMSWVAGRIGWMKSLAISCFVASISIVWLMFITEPDTLYLFAVAYGFSWGSTLALLGGAVAFFFGIAALSELLGFLLGLSVLVGATAPWLSGLSFDLTGTYLIAMAIAAFLFAAAGLLSLLLKPPR